MYSLTFEWKVKEVTPFICLDPTSNLLWLSEQGPEE